MAGHFDPHDIRSEMGFKEDVVPPKTTSEEAPKSPHLEMVPVVEEPMSLEAVAPGEPGNAIDLANPSDFGGRFYQFTPSVVNALWKSQCLLMKRKMMISMRWCQSSLVE